MGTSKLIDIITIENKDFRYEFEEFKNRKEWPIHKIFSEAWFNCEEIDRRKIETDVISRGDYSLFYRYIKKIHNHLNNTILRGKTHYLLEANGIAPDINTYLELEATWETLRRFNTELAILPKEKTHDTNASRKGIRTRQSMLRLLKAQLKEFITTNYPQLSSNRTTHIIKLLTSG